MIWTVAQVALGGALGAALRHLTQSGAARLMGTSMPWGTVMVNALGSLAMGLLFTWLAQKGLMRLAPFLTVGVLGAYTTFSTYAIDALTIWERGEAAAALAYVVGSAALSLGCVVAGVAIMRGMLA